MGILRYGCRRFCPLIKSLQRIKPLVELPYCKVFRIIPVSHQIHTSSVTCDLNEFFDEDHFDSTSVDVGRPWRVDELRIKDNNDLHKLWYVLLKERNQLMTMEAMYYDQNEAVPSPERMEKVEESMENLLEVIKERNDAFELFEFGETSAPKTYTIRNAVGIPYRRTEKEHYLPKHMNKRFNMMHVEHEPWMDKHLARFEEKFRKERRSKQKKLEKHKKELTEEFEISKRKVDKLVKKDNTDDQLDEYLKLTGELNDVQRTGR